jgi:hypothetical protein
MSGMEIFYYIVLPLTILLVAWIGVRVNEYYDDMDRRQQGK